MANASAYAAQDIRGTSAPLGAQLLNRSAAASKVSVSVVLPLRNQPQLTALIKRLYDRTDPLYGHFLKPKDFADQFGPDQADVDAVKAFASSHSLSVDKISGNRAIIKLSGPSSAIEQAFSVHLFNYADSSGRVFRSPDRRPSISSTLAKHIVGIMGLDTHAKPQPYAHRSAASGTSNAGPQYFTRAPNLSPADIRSIYGLTVNNSSGSGQTVGLFEMDGWTPTDITQYELQYGLPTVQPTLVSVDGGDGSSQSLGGAAEVTLDIDMVLALAPGVNGIDVYESGDNSLQGFVDIFNQMATDDIVNVASVSWGLSEFDAAGSTAEEGGEAVDFFTAENQALEQMAAQGQTVCVAAGDAGAYTDQYNYPLIPNTDDPGSEPFVLSVGGTDMTDNAAIGYGSETSWADKGDLGRGPDGTGGGGGVSSVWALPSYQAFSFLQTVNMQGSTALRNVPDVSLYGDYDTGGYWIYLTFPPIGSYWDGYNGTSAASPLWAGFIADVNSDRAANGEAPIGFVNPAIYQIAENPQKYAADFHDIADGSNNLFYKAVPGYDNSTGWGSFVGDNLAADLVGVYSSLVPTSVAFAPNQIAIGQQTTVTVVISAPAPFGGVSVPVTANGQSYGSVDIPAGSNSGTIAYTPTVAGPEEFSATYNGVSVSGTVGVVSALALESLQLNPNYIFNTNGVGPVEVIVPPSVPATTTAPAIMYYVNYTVSLNAAAPPGGVTANLSWTGPLQYQGAPPLANPAGTVQIGTVRFNAGETTQSGMFPSPWSPDGTTTAPVPGEGVGNYVVTASLGNSSATASMPVVDTKLDPVLTMSFNPQVVAPGANTSATVTLPNAAPTGGELLAIFEGTPGSAPGNPAGNQILIEYVTVPAGAVGVTFPFTAALNDGNYYFTAYTFYDGYEDGAYADATLTVSSSTSAMVVSAPPALNGPCMATGTVSLVTPQSVDATIALTSSTPVLGLPSNVVIPAGEHSASFNIVAQNPSGYVTATITAALGPLTAFTYVGVNPTAAPTLRVTVPASIVGGNSTTGTVTLAATSGSDTTIGLSSNSALATVPGSVVVPAGSRTASFAIGTQTTASSTPVTITATDGGASANGYMIVNPSPISTVQISAPSSVYGDHSVTGTVTLSPVSMTSGTVVTLASSNPALLSVPTSVTIPAGSYTTTFTITAQNTAASTSATVTATFATSSQKVQVTVLPYTVDGLYAPSTLYGSHTATVVLAVNTTAPDSGTVVTLSSSNPALLSVPASVTVPAGSSTTSFTITAAQNPQINSSAIITATLAPSSQTAQVTVLPYTVLSVAGPGTLYGNHAGTGTVTLNTAALPAGATVTLTSSNPALLSVASSVTIPGGSNTGLFTMIAQNTASDVQVTITAKFGLNSQTTQVEVAPFTVLSVSTPAAVQGGTGASGTITLNTAAPAGGATVSLSSNSTLVGVPATVTVPSGATTASFPISTQNTTAATNVTITASIAPNSTTTSLVVEPYIYLVTISVPSIGTATNELLGGATTDATIVLSEPAPVGGAVITCTSSPISLVTVPVKVVIPAGQTTYPLPIAAAIVSAPAAVTVTGSWEGRFVVLNLTVVPSNLSASYVLTASAGANGSILPAGAVTVAGGTNTQFNATPNSGYQVNQWTLDGAVVATGSTSYTITNVRANHTINVSFSPIGSVSHARFDFNGDGKDDLLWANSQTGQLSVWYMNGTTASLVGPVFAAVNTNWAVKGVADINGDGHPDLLWWNSKTGQMIFWEMTGAQGTTQLYTSPVVYTVSNTQWQPVSMADFNGDGHPDILWENMTTGQLIVWYMNGMTQKSTTSAFATLPANCRVAGTGDFNQDGHPDIVVENVKTGAVSIWYMGGSGGTTIEQQGAPFVTINTAWQIASTGDTNGDGHPDLTWHNASTGQTIVWLMGGANGTTQLSLGTPLAVTPAPVWNIVGVR